MLLLDGVNINCTPNGGSTALHKATYCNKLDVVGFLLTNGADVEARDEDGNTPLILAVFLNHVSIVRLLLEKRANIDVHDYFGQTPFLFAEKKGHVQVTQLLVEYSSKRVYEAELLQALREKQYPDAATLLHQDIIDANLCDHDKMPLLHLIVATQNMWLLRTMLAKPQLDVNARDKGGRTALTFAIALFNVEVALALYQAGTRIDMASTKLLASTPLFGNALLRAASVDDASVVIQLLGLGVLPAFANETGETALHLAAAKGHTTTVTRLLEHLQAGDDLNATNHWRQRAGASPLFVAIAGGHAHVVGQLVAANARKDCVTNDGSTLLHAAVRSRNMSLLDLVLSFASDRNACDSLGQTPLHVAVLLHHKEAVTCLVRADANVFATTKRGMTPYMSASDPGIRAILKDAETVFDEQLARRLEAAERRNPPPRRHSDASAPTLYQTTRSLPTPTDRRKQPASNVGLIEAVRQQEYDTVLQLLADGGNPNAATEAGDSLLHLAVIGGDHKIVSVLSQTRGVRLHVRNADGWTPLVLAVQLGRRRLASLLHTAARTLTPVVCTVAHAKDLDPATTLPSHDVVVDFASLLGGGAHGNVYKGTYKGRTVAVKFAKQTTDATGLEKEIETMQLCPSPYVLRLLAYTKSSNPKPILEYMDAGNLHEYLVCKRLGETTAVHVTPLQVAWVVANALADLHHDGLLHRDIKSPNVLLCATNFIKLADLGIAREFESDMTMGIGTLRWMAPELLDRHGSYNAAADMYAFGALLTELDTLELPFASETVSDDIRRKLSEGSLRPHFTPTCAPWLHDLATACLSFDPTARPTAQERATTRRRSL
ncbi:TKL protein kinase [Saprolegnia parasitica CBS 223.65]|uniref:TKL protein kinase n=1 Tax=Saprolegnia parasitica (strain CBS 223.65) TaxID=695850 RepID=A0A067C332_SAPPC|nr:TKL protein kinase [Saprolegnia parasitica CBS 223.65]KDO20976.1 TKL protein kinase [Saprolegnia parasitica CBS 223.65]|eukprot:XP_012208289.1 TKL protein kinase [Saprolegnia parasitica CBS 223.65]